MPVSVPPDRTTCNRTQRTRCSIQGSKVSFKRHGNPAHIGSRGNHSATCRRIAGGFGLDFQPSRTESMRATSGRPGISRLALTEFSIPLLPSLGDLKHSDLQSRLLLHSPLISELKADSVSSRNCVEMRLGECRHSRNLCGGGSAAGDKVAFDSICMISRPLPASKR